MASTVTLSAGVRQNLLSLQDTAALLSQTQQRLSTGKKVNSALDNPNNFFAAQGLQSRASDLGGLLDYMSNAVKTLQAANTGNSAISKLVEAGKALANQALASTDATERSNLATQFGAIRTQIDQLATDASFNGVNLINGDNLTVNFNENATSSLTIIGVDETSGSRAAGVDGILHTVDDVVTGLGVNAAVGSWALSADIQAALDDLNTATTTLRSDAKSFGSNLTVVQTRQDFSKSLINVLQVGADNLVLADVNEESANMLALQTRQQLSTVALSLAAQADQAVLRLF